MAKAKRTAKKVGRPSGRKPLLTLRIDPLLYDQLVAASVASQISVAEETVGRLKQSFTTEEIFGGPDVRHIALNMVVNFYSAGQQAAAANGHPEWTARKWLLDTDCFRTAMIQVISSLMDLHNASLEEKQSIYEDLKGRAAFPFANPRF